MKEKIVSFFKKQLVEGADPKGMALTCAAGVTIAIFPILGSTTALCLLLGIALKLNQPVLQSLNYVLYPLQILLLPAFIYWGAVLTGTPPLDFKVDTVVSEFTANPTYFLSKYGEAGLHGILVWIVIAPFLAFMIYQISLRLFIRLRTT